MGGAVGPAQNSALCRCRFTIEHHHLRQVRYEFAEAIARAGSVLGVPVLGWIVVSGLAMSLIALVGSVSVVVPENLLRRMVIPLVALAAGALLGGAMFHMLPQSLGVLDDALSVFVWAVAGLFAFHVLEQFLHWHHCHRPVSEHRPLGYMILAADGLHNLIGGLASGSAFLVDVRLGIVTWIVAAAHEVPQELGDFGILVHSGWDGRRRTKPCTQ